MKKIINFFDKFKKILPPHYILKNNIIKTIEDITNITIEKKDISIINNIAYFKNTPAIKNEIFIKKTIILNKIKENHKSLLNIL